MSFIEERRAVYAGFRTRELAVAGDGPAVVLLHGFADSADTWRQVLHFMHDAGQSAVAVDLPGFGAADRLADGELLPQLDAFVAEAIRHYGRAKRVVVGGNSLGAAAAVRAGRNKDLPVAAVMPLDIAGITWKPVFSAIHSLAVGLGILAAVPVPHRSHHVVARQALSRWLYGERSAVDPQVVTRFAESIPDVRAAHRLLRLGARFKAELDRTDQHGGIDVPLTVIHGARDRLVPTSASRILHEANPGSRLIILDHAGHCPQLDATEAVAQYACQLADACTHTKEIS